MKRTYLHQPPRIFFNITDFPNFLFEERWDHLKWAESFEQAGYLTYRFGPSNNNHYHSLSEEEYTLFVLRWS